MSLCIGLFLDIEFLMERSFKGCTDIRMHSASGPVAGFPFQLEVLKIKFLIPKSRII